MQEKLRIAGLNVLMEQEQPLLKNRSRKYLADFVSPADIEIIDIEKNIQIQMQQDPMLSLEEAEYIATGSRFYNRLVDFDGFMLHSSAVCYNGKAYLFTADSGMGKSTHTNLWKTYLGDDAFILNDDKPAIRLIDGKFFAAGTPWSGKSDLSENIMLPIGGVAVLKRGENRIVPLNPTDAVVPILSQTAFPTTAERVGKLSLLLDFFVKTAGIFEFHCDVSEESVKTSFEALTKQKYFKKEI